MTKAGLFTGAALGVMLAAGATQAATHKHVVHKRVVHTHTVRTVHEEGGGLSAEVQELRAEVRSLQSRLDGQATTQRAEIEQAQSQAATAQATATATQAELQTAQAQVLTIPTQVAAEVARDKPKTDKLYYKGVTIKLGGFLEAAAIERSRSLTNDISSNFNSLPFANSRAGHENETRFTARQSRVSALVEGNATPGVHLAMYGEFDFQGAAQSANSNESNSYNPRIRHLYGTVDFDDVNGGGMGLHFLAGQNWSLVTMNTKGITPRNELTPPQIDAQYVPGFAWTRQPQFRATADFLDHKLWLAVSAENPQTTFYTTGARAGATALTTAAAASLPSSLTYNAQGGSGFNSANTLSLNGIPDFVAKAAYEAKIGGRTLHVEGFGLFRAFYDRRNLNTGGVGPGTADNVYGGGGGFGVVLQAIPDVLDLQISGLAGKGVGRYGTSGLPDVTFRPDGRIEPITEYMALAGGTLHANKLLDVYAFVGEEQSSRRAYTVSGATAGSQLAYGYGNPLYTNAGCSTEGSAACVGNSRTVEQGTLGFWQKLYAGPFGRAQVGMQYSYTARHAYSGVGGAPTADDNMLFVSFRYYPF